MQIIDSAQEFRDGCTNVGVLKGRKLLAIFAREFRVSLSFILRNPPFGGFLRREDFVKLKGG